MSEQLLKVFNITPHALESPKAASGDIIGSTTEAATWPIFFEKIRKRVLPRVNDLEFDKVGALLVALKSDNEKLWSQFVEDGTWDQSTRKLMKKLQRGRRLVSAIEINKSFEEILERDFVQPNLEDRLCGTICSSSLEEDARPPEEKLVIRGNDLTSFPNWFFSSEP